MGISTRGHARAMTQMMQRSMSRTPSRRVLRSVKTPMRTVGVFNMEKNSKRNTRANAAANKAPGKATEAPKVFESPPLDPSTPSPVFGVGTGGLLRKAQIEEFYVITWDASKEQIFEMPTGGSAIMNKGGNLLKQPRKEHCLALLTQLRTKFKIDGCVEYLHPKDGVYPEKVNKGRVAVNTNDRSIGQNVNPIAVKFTGKNAYDI